MNLNELAVAAQTDADAKTELMHAVRPLVRNAVNRIVGTGAKLPKEDLYQEGFIAVLEALPGYDPAKGRFDTYIFRFVRGAVSDVAGHHYTGFSLPESAITRYRQAMAHATTEAEAREYVMERGLMTGETFDATHAAITGVWLMGSLQAEDAGMDIADGACSFPAAIVNRQAIHAELAKLPERERDILEMAYGFRGEPMSDGAIADVYSLPRQNVQRIRTRAMARLASNLEDSK